MHYFNLHLRFFGLLDIHIGPQPINLSFSVKRLLKWYQRTWDLFAYYRFLCLSKGHIFTYPVPMAWPCRSTWGEVLCLLDIKYWPTNLFAKAHGYGGYLTAVFSSTILFQTCWCFWFAHNLLISRMRNIKKFFPRVGQKDGKFAVTCMF